MIMMFRGMPRVMVIGIMIMIVCSFSGDGRTEVGFSAYERVS